MEKPNLIPHFVEANTKEELVRKMLKINLEKNAFHRFFDIQKTDEGWIAWYYRSVTLYEQNT